MHNHNSFDITNYCTNEMVSGATSALQPQSGTLTLSLAWSDEEKFSGTALWWYKWSGRRYQMMDLGMPKGIFPKKNLTSRFKSGANASPQVENILNKTMLQTKNYTTHVCSCLCLMLIKELWPDRHYFQYSYTVINHKEHKKISDVFFSESEEFSLSMRFIITFALRKVIQGLTVPSLNISSLLGSPLYEYAGKYKVTSYPYFHIPWPYCKLHQCLVLLKL